MTAKEYLSIPRKLEKEIRYLECNLETYEHMMKSISVSNFETERVDKSPNKDTPNMIGLEKYYATKEKLDQVKLELARIIVEIEKTIEKIEKIEHKMMLKYRYLSMMSWYNIACKMFVSISTIKRWHNEALEDVIILIKD